MIRVALYGTGDFGEPIFTKLGQDQDYLIVGVVTQPAKNGCIEHWAKENNLPIIITSSLKDEQTKIEIEKMKVDLNVVIDFGLIIPAELISAGQIPWLNVHASLLPKYRGAAPIQAAIFNHEEKTGVTFMLIDQGVDTGPIISQYEMMLTDDIKQPDLRKKLAELAAEHGNDIKEFMTGKKQSINQNSELASQAKKLTRDDGRCRWESAATEARRVRAYDPWPGAWSTRQGKIIKFIQARSQDTSVVGAVGEIVKIATDPGWAVVCRDGIFIPELLQTEGKKPQPAKSYLGSYPDFIGSKFET